MELWATGQLGAAALRHWRRTARRGILQTVTVVPLPLPVSWEEETVIQTLTVRAASPVVTTTVETTGPHHLAFLTAVSDRAPANNEINTRIREARTKDSLKF